MPSYLQAVCLILLAGGAAASGSQEPQDAAPLVLMKEPDTADLKETSTEALTEAAEDTNKGMDKIADAAKATVDESDAAKAAVDESDSTEVTAEQPKVTAKSDGTGKDEVQLCPTGRIPTYIMSLNSRYDRWERASVRFMGLSLLDPTLCIEVERSPATNGEKDPIPMNMVTKTWKTDRNRQYVGNGTWYDKVEKELELTPGERGCAASHIRLWKKIAKMTGPVIIVEDDAVPKKDFPKLLKKGLQEVPADADLLYLGYSRPDKAPWRSLISESLAEVDYVWTTVGYIIWPKGARKLLERLPIDSPVDNFMSWASHTNHTKVYALTDAAITQELPWSVLNDVKHSDEISKNKKEREEFRKQVTLFTRPFREAQEQFTQQMNAAILGLDTLDNSTDTTKSEDSSSTKPTLLRQGQDTTKLSETPLRVNPLKTLVKALGSLQNYTSAGSADFRSTQ